MSVRVHNPEGSDVDRTGEQSRVSRSNIHELRRILDPLNIRSFALSAILLLLTVYSLKLASAFLIPVVLALLFFSSPR